MQNFGFVSLVLFLFYSGNGWAEESHGSKGRAVAEKLVTAEISKSELLNSLNQVILAQRDSSGSIVLGIRETSEAKNAIRKIRELFGEADIISYIMEHLKEPAEVWVYSPYYQNYEAKKSSLNGLGALVALGLSTPHSSGDNRRSLVLGDPSRVYFEMPITSKPEKDTIQQTTTILENFKTKRPDGEISREHHYKLHGGTPGNRPADYQFTYNKTNDYYERISNLAAVIDWEAQGLVKRSWDKSDFQKLIKEEILKSMRTGKGEGLQEAVTAELELSGVPENLRTPVRTKLNELINSQRSDLLNPNKEGSVKVARTPLAGEQTVLPKKPAGVTRMAFIKAGTMTPQGSLTEMQVGASEYSGATAIYRVNSLKEAIPYIQKQFKDNGGQKVEVILGGHGRGGSIPDLIAPGTQETKDFLKATQGMVSAGWFMGCHVGEHVDSFTTPHILREAAVGWGATAYGIDNYCVHHGSGFQIHAGGNRVEVSPNWDTLP